MRKLFKGGNYSRAETIWGNTVCTLKVECSFRNNLNQQIFTLSRNFADMYLCPILTTYSKKMNSAKYCENMNESSIYVHCPNLHLLRSRKNYWLERIGNRMSYFRKCWFLETCSINETKSGIDCQWFCVYGAGENCM